MPSNRPVRRSLPFWYSVLMTAPMVMTVVQTFWMPSQNLFMPPLAASQSFVPKSARAVATFLPRPVNQVMTLVTVSLTNLTTLPGSFLNQSQMALIMSGMIEWPTSSSLSHMNQSQMPWTNPVTTPTTSPIAFLNTE